MEQNPVVFEGYVDGVQFTDYDEFTKYIKEHPESRNIRFAMDTKPDIQKPEDKQALEAACNRIRQQQAASKALEETKERLENAYFPTTGRVIEKGQVYDPDKLLYPVLETPDHYLTFHDPSRWMSDLDWVVNSLKHFLIVHNRNIQCLSDEEISKHYETLEKCHSDVIEALDYNIEAAKHVDKSKAGYEDEVTRLNAQIKECRQRINEIRREHLGEIDDKRQALTAAGKLLDIYKDAYYQLLTQTSNEIEKRHDEMHKKEEERKATAAVSGHPGVSQRDSRGMARLLHAIFGS